MFHLIAQTTDVTTGIDSLYLNLASVTGVVTSSTLLVQRVVKPLAARFPTTLGRVHTMVYVALFAVALTYVSNRYLLILPGNDVARLIRDTILAVFASFGFYTLPEAAKPVSTTKSEGILLKKDSAPTVAEVSAASSSSSSSSSFITSLPVLILLLLPIFLLAGCAGSADPFYNGVAAQWPPVRDTYNRLVTSDPTLSPEERQVELNSAITLDRLITAEGARRASNLVTNPLLPNSSPSTRP